MNMFIIIYNEILKVFFVDTYHMIISKLYFNKKSNQLI